MTLSNKYFTTQNVCSMFKIHALNTGILLYKFCLFLAKWNILYFGLGLNVTSSTWKQLKCDICSIVHHVLCFYKILLLLIIAFSYPQKEGTIILSDTLYLLCYLQNVLSNYVVMECVLHIQILRKYVLFAYKLLNVDCY